MGVLATIHDTSQSLELPKTCTVLWGCLCSKPCDSPFAYRCLPTAQSGPAGLKVSADLLRCLVCRQCSCCFDLLLLLLLLRSGGGKCALHGKLFKPTEHDQI
jgi:hypothetical protein